MIQDPVDAESPVDPVEVGTARSGPPEDTTDLVATAGSRPGTRYGVLVTVVVIALLLRWAAVAPWWSRIGIGEADTASLSLGTLRGQALLWLAAAACVAYGVASLPVPRQLRRAAGFVGMVLSLAAVGVLIALAVRVLRHDADMHMAQAEAIWRQHLAEQAARGSLGPFDPSPGASDDGVTAAIMAAFLLLMLGPLLLATRRHERTVLVVATMALIVAGLLLPASAWVIRGPHTVHREWIWLPTYLHGSWPVELRQSFPHPPRLAWLAAMVLLLYTALLGAVLAVRPRPGAGPQWSVCWVWALGVLWVAGFVAAAYLIGAALFDGAFAWWAAPVSEGVRFNAPLLLVMVQPLVVAVRFGMADTRGRSDPD